MILGRRDAKAIVGVIAAAIILAAASTVALASAGGGFRSNRTAPNGSCRAPRLSGTVIDVRLMNMGGPMMGGVGGTRRLVASRRQVPAGVVSFRDRRRPVASPSLRSPNPAVHPGGQRTLPGTRSTHTD